MIKTNKVKLEIHYDHIIRDYDLYRIQPKRTDEKDEEKCVLKRSLEKLDQLSPVLAVLYRYKGPVYLIFEKWFKNRADKQNSRRYNKENI